PAGLGAGTRVVGAARGVGLGGGGARVGRPLLVRQADGLAGLDVDLVHIGPAPAADIVEVGVVDPLRVEGHVGVGDRALVAGDEDFLAAVGVQEHQVRRGAEVLGLPGVGPDGRGPLLAVGAGDEARGADVDDVVVVLHRLVGRNGRRVDAQEPLRGLIFAVGGAGRRLAGEEDGGPDG